jgi:hypothetical protein
MKKSPLVFFCLFAAVAAPLRGETLLAITSDRKINFFDSTAPNAYFKTVNIVGLGGSDVVLSAACNATGQLFVLTRAGTQMGVRIFDPQTGAILEDSFSTVAYPAAATGFGMDVNPASQSIVDVADDTDEIQFVSTSGAGAAVPLSYDNTTSDGDPVDVHAGANPAIVGIAHTNNFPGAQSSVLYGIDSTQDTLVMIEQDIGRLNTIGALGVNTGAQVGFDISGVTGNAYAAFSTIAGPLLYKINLSTGAGTLIGQLPASSPAGVVIVAITTLPPTRLANISTRGRVGAGDDVMIAGFIVQGSAPKRVIVRAAGPSLTQFGVPDALANPRLELHDNSSTIGMNDDWQTTQIGGVITSDQVAEIQNSGLPPSDPAESAVIATLAPGSYTVIVQGANSGTGVGIVEVYDLGATSGSLLANISTRGFVQTGDDVMIGGFIVVTQPTRVIIRAIGPSLTDIGVPDVLVNPQLELYDATGMIGRNDDWETTEVWGIITSNQVEEIQNCPLVPTNPAESAIIATLPPGSYTAIVRGVNNTAGNALVEVYSLQ